ncbi:MAG: hypothetical protein K9J85_07465 [Desulfobacteraceae bacterium]|nr:hypothetical protein [Desulfobacteraceae bacterium]
MTRSKSIKTDFKDYICRPFCIFFAEDEKEDMACLGARTAARLYQGGKISEKNIRNVEKDRGVWEKHRTDLGFVLCRACEFKAQDCDFQSPEPSDDLEPCGGYIVLVHLIENRTLDITDLEKVL